MSVSNEKYYLDITPQNRFMNEEMQLWRDILGELQKLNALLSSSSVTTIMPSKQKTAIHKGEV